VFYKLMKLDLNQGMEVRLEERFARENTNDIGDPLSPESAFIILSEFKKFLFISCVEIHYLKTSGKIKASVENEKTYFECPFSPPPYLDRLWRLFILNHEGYSNFCELMTKGFIDRNDPRHNPA
jgi:hypothetical protein